MSERDSTGSKNISEGSVGSNRNQTLWCFNSSMLRRCGGHVSRRVLILVAAKLRPPKAKHNLMTQKIFAMGENS
jgi:hypothetical protein